MHTPTQKQIRTALENVIGQVSEMSDEAREFAKQTQPMHAKEIARKAKNLSPEDTMLLYFAIDTLTK